MFIIGSHLSTVKGYLAMGKQAVAIGANTFQFFIRNPRGGAAKKLNPADIAAFNQFAKENNIGPIMGHASYTLNPAAGERLRDFVRTTMADDLDRLEHTPGAYYNFHPGSHQGQGVPAAIKIIAETLNIVMKKGQSSLVLLETMTGKGTEVGGTFEELRDIIKLVKMKERMGVTLDTCHVFDAGYDIVNDLDGVLEQFDQAVGLDRLKALHLNDSKNKLGDKKDRHAAIGEGNIGMGAFARIINHPKLRHLPCYLETPNDVDGYANEIAMLKAARKSDGGEKAKGKKIAAKDKPEKAVKSKGSGKKAKK
ncbi:MAG: deoxyribonuclease IV [Planctomycetes bacterium]|nr:deoxyribonuclease IV [Planctomycetota bacterium]